MKKTIFVTLLLTILCVGMAQAKKRPQIQFEQTNIDVGTFPESDPIRTVQFKFKNVGNAKLVIKILSHRVPLVSSLSDTMEKGNSPDVSEKASTSSPTTEKMSHVYTSRGS